MLLSIVIFACFDNILAIFGLSFAKWVNIFDDYFERMLLRWESTEKSNIPHNIYIACLSFYILSVFTRVYESTAIANLIINGVLSSPWNSFKRVNTVFCNYFKMPVVLIVETLTIGNVWFISSNKESTLCFIVLLSLSSSLKTLPKINSAKLLSELA